MASVVPDKCLVEEVSYMYLDSCYAMPQPLIVGRTLSTEGRKISLIGGIPPFSGNAFVSQLKSQ